MITFTCVVHVGAPAAAVWRLVTDWQAHGRWIPLTRMSVLTQRPDGVGARFVGRSGVGPLAFDDPMEVVEWEPATGTTVGLCRVRKLGALRGGALITVHPGGQDTVVRWRETVGLGPDWLLAPVSPALGLAGRLLFTRALRAMAAEARGRARLPGASH